MLIIRAGFTITNPVKLSQQSLCESLFPSRYSANVFRCSLVMPLCGVAHFPPNRLNRLLYLRTRLCILLSRRTCLASRLTVNGSPPLSSSTFPRMRLYFRRSLTLFSKQPLQLSPLFLLSPSNEEVFDSVSGAASLFWGFCTCVATFGFNDCSFSPVGAEPPPLDALEYLSLEHSMSWLQ